MYRLLMASMISSGIPRAANTLNKNQRLRLGNAAAKSKRRVAAVEPGTKDSAIADVSMAITFSSIQRSEI